MDFTWTPEQEALRTEAREMAAHAVATYGRANDSWINGWSKEFALELGAKGWIGLTWPSEFGGGGRPAIDRLIIGERGAIAFAPHLALKSSVLRDAVLSSPISEVAHDIIGPEARLYHDQAVYKENEKPRRFPWHQDNGYTFVSPENYLTVWIALTDAMLNRLATKHSKSPR